MSGTFKDVLQVPLTDETTDTLRLALVWVVHPPSKGLRILIACGPGNNGMSTQTLPRYLSGRITAAVGISRGH